MWDATASSTQPSACAGVCFCTLSPGDYPASSGSRSSKARRLTAVRRRILLPAIVFAALLAGPSAAHALQPLTTGFTDSHFGTRGVGLRSALYDDAKRLGASRAQVA